MKQILVLCFSKLQHDARVSRQVDFLKNDYHVTAVVYDGLPDPTIELIKIAKPKLTFLRKGLLAFFLILRQHRAAYSLLYGNAAITISLANHTFDLIIANDVECLPLAFEIDPRGTVLFDAHEYAPRHFEDRWSWRVFFQPLNVYLCRKYLPKVKAMTTVGKGLASEYERNFSVKPIILTNATWYHEIEPSPVDPRRIRMIHHGGATRSRKLELMIELMHHLEERFTLDLMLITPQLASAKTRNYIHHLQKLADGDPRIRFLPPLKSNQIVDFINQYDLGLFLILPINFNYANTLPNKLFDFIQARLGIAIGPTPEMAAIVETYDLGVVSKEFSVESLAIELNNLSATDIVRYKKNSAEAAKKINADINKKRFLEIIEGLLK